MLPICDAIWPSTCSVPLIGVVTVNPSGRPAAAIGPRVTVMPTFACDNRLLTGLLLLPLKSRGVEASRLRPIAAIEIATGAITFDGRFTAFIGGSAGRLAMALRAPLSPGR